MHFITIQVCRQMPALFSFCIMLDQFASMKIHIAHMLDALDSYVWFSILFLTSDKVSVQ